MLYSCQLQSPSATEQYDEERKNDCTQGKTNQRLLFCRLPKSMLHFAATTAAAGNKTRRLDSLKHFIKLPPSVCCYVSQSSSLFLPFLSLSLSLSLSLCQLSRVASFRFLGTNPAVFECGPLNTIILELVKYIHIYIFVCLYISV